MFGGKRDNARKLNDDPFSYDSYGNPRILSKQFVLILLVSFFIRMCQQMQNTTLPLFIQDVLGGTTAEAGVLVSIFMMSALVSRLFIGGLVDKRGRKPIIFGGVAVFGITVIAFGYVKSIPALYAIRAIQGIGFAGLTTAISTAVTDMTPENRLSEGIGYYGLTQSLTQAIGPMIIIYVIGSRGYDNLFNFFSLFAIVALVIASTLSIDKFRVAKLRQRMEAKEAEEDTGELVQSSYEQYQAYSKLRFIEKFIEPKSVLPALCITFSGIATTAVGTFLPTYGLSMGLEGIGIFFTVQAVAVAVSRLFAGKISARHGSSVIIVPSAILIGICLIALSFAKSLVVFVVIAAVYGLSFGALQPEINSITISMAPFERRGLASSTYFNFLDLGNAIGASLWGFLSGVIGLQYIFAAGSISIIVLLLVYSHIYKKMKPKKRSLKPLESGRST